MRKILQIKPYKEFYMNCSLNNFSSLLTFANKSYEVAAFVNSYRYSVYSFSYNPLKFISVNFDNSYEDLTNKNYIIDENYFFKDMNNIAGELKELIILGKPIFLYIDLFNWIPDNIAWQKHHWNHFSLIIGFDDNKKVFYAIDDDAKGSIDIREIPEERLINSFKGTGYFVEYGGYHTRPDIESPCKIINISECIEPYKINLDQIIANAKIILEDIEKINQSGFWEFIDDSNLDVMSDSGIAELNIIYNRHIGNKLLIMELYKENIIKSDYYEFLYSSITNIINNWNKAKNILIKSKYKNTLSQISVPLIEICNKNLQDEACFWNSFLNSTIDKIY